MSKWNKKRNNFFDLNTRQQMYNATKKFIKESNTKEMIEDRNKLHSKTGLK